MEKNNQNQSKERKCHRCKVRIADLCNEKEIIVKHPVCKKCIRECLTMAWKYLIEYRVFTSRWFVYNQNDEEAFECFSYVDALLGYDRSPDKPVGSDNLFGKGRWKIIRRIVGFFIAYIAWVAYVALGIFVSDIIKDINFESEYAYLIQIPILFPAFFVFGIIAIWVYDRIAYFIQMLELWDMVSKNDKK